MVFICPAREKQNAYKTAVPLSHCEICLTISWDHIRYCSSENRQQNAVVSVWFASQVEKSVLCSLVCLVRQI